LRGRVRLWGGGGGRRHLAGLEAVRGPARSGTSGGAASGGGSKTPEKKKSRFHGEVLFSIHAEGKGGAPPSKKTTAGVGKRPRDVGVATQFLPRLFHNKTEISVQDFVSGETQWCKRKNKGEPLGRGLTIVEEPFEVPLRGGNARKIG